MTVGLVPAQLDRKGRIADVENGQAAHTEDVGKVPDHLHILEFGEPERGNIKSANGPWIILRLNILNMSFLVLN